MFKQIIVFSFLLHLSWAAPDGQSQKEDEHDCESKIFCHGDLLETIQMSGVNGNDAKKYVQKKIQSPYSPDDVWNKFMALKEEEKGKDLKDNVEVLSKFIKEYFDEDKLQSVEVTDYKKTKYTEEQIADKTYLEFYRQINSLWTDLGVKTADRLPGEDPNRYSMIALPKYFIKTGDSQSFPELWQNYLILRGLLWNDMFDSALNIIENLAELSTTPKFIPLTNRVYAMKRHQLPLLSFMVEDYLQAYNAAEDNNMDSSFLQKMFPVVENELNWWIDNARAGIKKDDQTDYMLFKYTSYGNEPRPDNFQDDYNVAKKLPSRSEKVRFYSAVRALDETAFGYSSRFLQNKQYQETRSNLEVDRFVPVELNSVLQRCASILSNWLTRLGKGEAAKYEKLADEIQYGIDMILWSDKHQIWLDYDLKTNENVDSFYITNIMPLFTLSYKETFDLVPSVLNYLVREKIISIDSNSNYHFNLRAIPTSNMESGEISDKPYGSIFWNLLIIDGLRETNVNEARQVAKQVAAALVKTIHNEYESHGTLFENYRIDRPIEKDEIEKLNKSSSSTLGGIITLLGWYGSEIKSTETGGTSEVNMSEALSESNLSTSGNDGNDGNDDFDFSFGKRPADTSTATDEDKPVSKLPDTSDIKKRKVEVDIEKTEKK